MPNHEVEVCVLGGGPAGSVIARRLAQLGHRTLVIERNPEPRGQRTESLAPSILQILDSLGLSGAVVSATLCREKRALVRWDSISIQTKLFEHPSLLVQRSLLDLRLREEAARAGANVLAPASARTPQRMTSGGWLIPAKTSKGLTTIAAHFLIDARGKRWSTSAAVNGPRTVAISAAWRHTDKTYMETRIEAGTDEWYWGCPLRHGLYSATVFVDATRAAGLSGDARKELYQRLLFRSELLSDLSHGAMATPISVRDATSHTASDLIEEDYIRIGEAAFSIDPLSSQGVQSAILSAIHGAAAVHTIRMGHDPRPAMTFFRDRQQFAAIKASGNAERLYRRSFCNGSSPFWMTRSGASQNVLPHQKMNPDALGSLPPFARLSKALKIVEVPVLCGTIIRQARALNHPSLDHPIAYIGGIALAPLAVDVTDGAETGRLMAHWAQRMPAKTARHILTWMTTLGLIEACDAERHRCVRTQASRNKAVRGKRVKSLAES